MDKPILVVDILSFSSLIIMLTKFASVRQVFYLRKAEGIVSGIILKILKKRGWSFERVLYTSSPTDGISPYKKLHKLLIEKKELCREEIFAKELNKVTGISEYERKRMATSFAKYAGGEIYFAVQLFVSLNNDYFSHDIIQTVLLRRSIFSSIISDMYKNAGFTTYFYRYFGHEKYLPLENYVFDKVLLGIKISGLRSFIKTMLLIFQSFLFKFVFTISKVHSLHKKHKICALVCNYFATESANCLPWQKTVDSYIKGETLVVCPPSFSDAAKRFYKERSSQLIEFSFKSFQSNMPIEMKKTWSYFSNFFLKNIVIYRKLFGLKSINRWISKHLLAALIYLSFFEALFKYSGSKIFWSMKEQDFGMQMAAIAINRLGGISLGTTWSQNPFPEWESQHNELDVFFLWGTRLAKIRKDNYDQCHFFVTTGYPADRTFNRELDKANDFRNLLFNRYKAKNILSFFDDVVAEDVFVPPQEFSGLYEEIFAWLEEDPANFLIIKAKRAETINKYAALKKKIDDFCKKRRIFILYDRAAIYPGLAADTTISPSMTLLSLVGLLGRRVIFYDIHNVTEDYPLALPNVRIISRRKEVRQAINSAIQESHEMRYQENRKPITGSAIDSFGDGKAADRICGYIHNLLKKFKEGFSNTEAMAFANEQYIKKYGKNTVIMGPLKAS